MPRWIGALTAATLLFLPGSTKAQNATAPAEITFQRLPPPDTQTKKLLEGIWLVGEKPDNGSCASHRYSGTQIEFDFRKSGGRALIFVPYDLFTAIPLSGAESKDGVLTLQAPNPHGGFSTFLRLRIASSEQLEFQTPKGKNETAYRCGEPDRTVNDSIRPEVLAAFIPPTTRGGLLRAAIPGVPDADICQGKIASSEDKFLDVEIYGPVHYWIIGKGFTPPHRFDIDHIRSIRQIDAHTLKLEMQETVATGNGWNAPQPRSAHYELTLINTGTRLDVPELKTSFVKCWAGEPRNTGSPRQ